MDRAQLGKVLRAKLFQVGLQGPFAIAVLLALGMASVPAFAAQSQFTAELDPSPMTLANRANVMGDGEVSADLSGNTLTITGSFEGLSSPATDAHLQSGLAMGVPGGAFADLTVSQATNGSISGKVTLTRAQINALREGAVYVQINSVNSGPPYGNLRGWFFGSAQTP